MRVRFIGLSFFQSDSSLQGLQDTMFSIFMLLSILSSLSQQVSTVQYRQRAALTIIDYASSFSPTIALRGSPILVFVNFIVSLIHIGPRTALQDVFFHHFYCCQCSRGTSLSDCHRHLGLCLLLLPCLRVPHPALRVEKILC